MYTLSGLNLTTIGDNFISELGKLQGVLEYALQVESNSAVKEEIQKKINQINRTEQAYFKSVISAADNQYTHLRVIQGGRA